MTINEYFDKIYLLNLFKRKDRLNKSTAKLDDLNIKYSVFNGVDGSVINHLWNKLQNSYFSNPSYLGCAISHLSIYKDALENGYQRILIIEDDNLIFKNINNFFESREIPEWQDLFYLGYIPLSDNCDMWTYQYGIQGHNMIADNFFKPKNLWGLYSYGITNSLMRELVDVYNESFPMELDRYFVNVIQPRDKSIALSPQLFCCDDNIHSDNLGFIPTNMILKSIDSRFANPSDYF
jgi:GR25 family glycosyltransferase involved in LPS biosynthesis